MKCHYSLLLPVCCFVCIHPTLAGLAGTASDEKAGPDSEYVRAFKNFIEAPPAIKSVKLASRFTGPRRQFERLPDGHMRVFTNQVSTETFVEIRYQTNGLFQKEAAQYADLADPELKPGQSIYGWWGGDETCWSIGGPNHVLSITSSIGPDRIASRTEFFTTQMFMNFGMNGLGVGSLKWNGNDFRGTNSFGKPAIAVLKVGPDGRPSGMDFDFPNGWATNSTDDVKCSAMYSYNKSFPGWLLPTRIQVRSPRGGNLEIEVLSLEFAKKPGDHSSFQHESYLKYISEGAKPSMVVKFADGKRISMERFKPVDRGYLRIGDLDVKRSLIPKVLCGVFFVLVAGILIVVSLANRNRNPPR